ncbi:MAG TPA: TIGR03435 family protein [Bryobacteraceae bacterium]|nr:TIGR03435 family protein [Bryobacteraceae bacterium]
MPYRFTFLLIGMAAGVAAVAQVQPPAEFEVASIKPNSANDRIVMIRVGPGGRFAARGYTLQLLIQRAYGVMGWQISGASRWLDDDRYDVAATALVRGNLTEEELRPMLQRLLTERFNLKLHKDSKRMSGYALVVAPGGPKVKTAAGDEEHGDTFRMNNQTGLTAQSLSMETFSHYVAGKLGLVAEDETGLRGLYDFKADWRVEKDPSPPGGLLDADTGESVRSAVFAALQDQLGLKMVARTITVPMLVIDHAEKASPN